MTLVVMNSRKNLKPFGCDYWEFLDSYRKDLSWKSLSLKAGIALGTLESAKDQRRVLSMTNTIRMATVLGFTLDELVLTLTGKSYPEFDGLDMFAKYPGPAVAFWNNMTVILRKKGMTWSELGGRTGYTNSTLSSAKKCYRDISFEFAVSLADGIKCSLSQLTGHADTLFEMNEAEEVKRMIIVGMKDLGIEELEALYKVEQKLKDVHAIVKNNS